MAVLLLLGIAAGSPFISDHSKDNAQKVIGLANFLPEEVPGWTLTRLETPPEELDFEYLNELYKGVFVDSDQEPVVLLIEYGSDFRRRYQMHFPDVCHQNRGDEVRVLPKTQFVLSDGRAIDSALIEWYYPKKNVRALCAYWLVISNHQTANIFELKLRQFFAGIFQAPKDVYLVRFDTFYQTQETEKERSARLELLKGLVGQFYDALPEDSRLRFFGGAD